MKANDKDDILCQADAEPNQILPRVCTLHVHVADHERGVRNIFETANFDR